MFKSRVIVGFIAVAMLALSVTGVAWGAGAFTSSIPSSNTITACYATAGSLKPMYLIDPATTSSCPNGFTMVTFNQQGPQGVTGVSGPSGPSGATGAGASPSILAASSGPPISMVVSGFSGATSQVSVLPLSGSSSLSPVTAILGAIDLSSAPTNLVEVMPRSGVITGLSARFTNTVQGAQPTETIGLTAQVWAAAPSGNSFTPVGAPCVFSSLSGGAAPGATVACTVSMTTPVAAGTPLVVVFAASTSAILFTLTGNASSSLTIS